MPRTHILFDFDGTLVDSAPAILQTFEEVLRAHGISACRSIESSLIGPPLRQTLQILSGTDDAVTLDALSASFREIYDQSVCQTTPAYAGWNEALEQLRGAGLQLRIATNKRLLPTQRILQALGWDRHFSAVYASDSVAGGYADKAAMLAHLLQEQGLDASATLYLGDTLSDAKASAANGIEFHGVSWGYGSFDESYQVSDSPAQFLAVLGISPADSAR